MDEWVNKLLRVETSFQLPKHKIVERTEIFLFPPLSSVIGSADQFSFASDSCSFHFPCYVPGQPFVNSCQIVAVSSFWPCYLLSRALPLCSLAHCHLISFPRIPKGKTHSSCVSPIHTPPPPHSQYYTRCVVLSHSSQFSLTSARCPIVSFNSGTVYLEIVPDSTD